MLRDSIEELSTIFRLAATRKPRGHHLERIDCQNGFGGAVRAIGG